VAQKSSIYFLLLLFTSLGFASYLFSSISNSSKLVATIALYLIVIGVAILAKLNLKSMGLSRDTMTKGVLYALPFMAAIVIGAIVIFMINPEIFKDTRYQLTSPEMLYTVLLVIPFLTVVIEELAFRGVMFGLLQTVASQFYAIIISSVGFGVWHVFSASGIGTDGFSQSIVIPKIILIIGVILATTIAGAVFTWARIKSGSLITPILIHWTINSTGVILAYLAWNQ
jgi:membrane protease YdiL (CAAX protease family)